MEYRSFLDFLDKAEKLKCNTRHSWTSSGRHESVAEHSWRLALMAMLLGEQFSDLDRNKVIKMCLIHDLGEAVTGDIPAFVKTEKDEEVESKAVSGLFDTLPETQKKEMRRLQCYRICRKYQMEKYMAAMIWFGRRAETARDAMPAVRKWGHPLCLIPAIYGV